jgi:hypothetical protein
MSVSAKEVCDVWRMTLRLEVGSFICSLLLGPIYYCLVKFFWPNIEKGVILKVYFTPDPTLTIWRFGAF